MGDNKTLARDLTAVGLGELWHRLLSNGLVDDRLRAHGDWPKWSTAVEQLPDIIPDKIALDQDIVSADAQDVDDATSEEIREHLQALQPWRKGPFRLFGVAIDAEWRSDKKWRRLADHIAPLDGRKVLDVGCGNGYYAFRMRGAGADIVIGIDPAVLFVAQFAALKKLLRVARVHVLPLTLDDFGNSYPVFDTTFSMGVLYHRRDPHGHLSALFDTLQPGGELVLETLVAPGDGHDVIEPGSRYARMRNVWHLPTVATLTDWLETTGFTNVRLADVSMTNCDEQRSTEWMRFESLREALDAQDSRRTIEGLPAPTRAILICNTPAS